MADKQRWANAEKFFSRSWTHAFYSWKLRHVMLGRTVAKILRRHGKAGRLRIVDLGCANGTNIFDIYDVCKDVAQADWYGLDLNPGTVAAGVGRSRYRVQERGVQAVHFMVGDICRLPFADASIDVILSSEVVEHLPDPVPAIREMARVLKPGAYALITTPNPKNLPESIGYLLDRMTKGRFKSFYWRGEDVVSAPPLAAEVGYGHVSVHPYGVWRRWFVQEGIPVVEKVRGPILFGSPFFDRQRFLCGGLIALDPLLDRLPGPFLTSVTLGMLCRKRR